MNLLRRLGLQVRSLDALSLSRRPSTNALRSCDLVPTSPAAAEAAREDARWVMLNRLVSRMDGSVAADATTVAESRTAAGRHLRVSLALAAPPSSSFLYYDWVRGAPSFAKRSRAQQPTARVIAAHGDSVLFEMVRHAAGGPDDYFVYRAGGVGRPPSMSRLPSAEFWLFETSTGILRRSEEELLVAQLGIGTTNDGPELCVLRLGRTEWEVKTAVPITLLDAGGSKGDEPIPWQGSLSSQVAAVGDRFLCWVQYESGVLVCDMAEEEERRPELRYAPLPVAPPCWKHDNEDGYRPPIEYSRDVCGTGDGKLRFVGIDLRCCCGGFGMSTCEHARSAFMVTTWSLSLAPASAPAAWVKETVLHCEELWAFPGYEGLPRVHPECPVMSLHNPDVVYLRVGECPVMSLQNRDLVYLRVGDCNARPEESKVWIVEVDTRRKALLSITPCTTVAQKRYPHVPAEFQKRN